MCYILCVCVCVCVCLYAHSCPTLCDPMDCSLPSSSVHGIPRQEYWSGLSFPSPGDLPDPGIGFVIAVFHFYVLISLLTEIYLVGTEAQMRRKFISLLSHCGERPSSMQRELCIIKSLKGSDSFCIVTLLASIIFKVLMESKGCENEAIANAKPSSSR